MTKDTVVGARSSQKVERNAAPRLNQLGRPGAVKAPNARTRSAFRASDHDRGVTRAADGAEMLAKLAI